MKEEFALVMDHVQDLAYAIDNINRGKVVASARRIIEGDSVTITLALRSGEPGVVEARTVEAAAGLCAGGYYVERLDWYRSLRKGHGMFLTLCLDCMGMFTHADVVTIEHCRATVVHSDNLNDLVEQLD